MNAARSRMARGGADMSRPAGLSRRGFLGRAGAGLLGGALAARPAEAAAPPARTFGKAKAVVVLYLYGAPEPDGHARPQAGGPERPARRVRHRGDAVARRPGLRAPAAPGDRPGPLLPGPVDEPRLQQPRRFRGPVGPVALRAGARGQPGGRPALALFRLRPGVPVAARRRRHGPAAQRHPALAAQRPHRPQPLVAARRLAGAAV